MQASLWQRRLRTLAQNISGHDPLLSLRRIPRACTGVRRRFADRADYVRLAAQSQLQAGLIASSASQRAVVEADASETPRSTTSRCSSAREKRESGTPRSRRLAGDRFHLRDLIRGKTVRTTRTLPVLKPCQPVLKEAFPPASNHLRRRLEPSRDLGVTQPIGVEHHFRPLHHLERRSDRRAGPPARSRSSAAPSSSGTCVARSTSSPCRSSGPS
jgi:hypothetical protein